MAQDDGGVGVLVIMGAALVAFLGSAAVELKADNGKLEHTVSLLLSAAEQNASCQEALVEARILHADQLRLRNGGKPRVR